MWMAVNRKRGTSGGNAVMSGGVRSHGVRGRPLREVAMNFDEDGLTLYEGEALAVLSTLPDASVQCCVTSPPYWGLRDYGTEGGIGLESTPAAYVSALVAVFGEVKRVLRDDGVLWLNLGDSYTNSGKGGNPPDSKYAEFVGNSDREKAAKASTKFIPDGLKPKDLVGIPWRVAFALQADGWYLRSDIIWSKPNPMPESVRDRPTKAHEYVFLMSKSQRYFYDADAVREKAIGENRVRADVIGGKKGDAVHHSPGSVFKQDGHGRRHDGFNARWDESEANGLTASGRNLRTVWEIATQPSPLPHFAAFPDELASRCIKAGSAIGDVILDPFAGTGTTLKVARELRRKGIGIELSPEYHALAVKRLRYGVKGVMAIQNGQGTL